MSDVIVSGDAAAWNHHGRTVTVSVEALADAAIDAESGLVVALSRGGAGRLHLFGGDGGVLGTIEAPPGYSLSHLVRNPNGLLVVGAGETPSDGWHDWHFAIDAGTGRLNRAGPAY